MTQPKVSLLLALTIMLLLAADPVFGKTEAYDFTLTDIYGTPFSLSDYRGRVVVIDFFRLQPSCPPCISEIPHLKGVYNEYPQSQVVIMSLSVSTYDTDATLRKDFVEEYDVPWIVACGAGEFANTEYGVQFIPTLFIIDANGYYGDPHIGVTPESTLISEIDILLAGTENGNSNGGSETPYSPMAIVGGAVVASAVIGAVLVWLMLRKSKPSPKKAARKKRKR